MLLYLILDTMSTVLEAIHGEFPASEGAMLVVIAIDFVLIAWGVWLTLFKKEA